MVNKQQNLVTLRAEEMAVLLKDFPGVGGAQSFFRLLWTKLDRDSGEIGLTDEEVGRIYRYARYARGDGGYEGRLRKAFGRSLAAPFVSEQRGFDL
jgi:hypothetical protein